MHFRQKYVSNPCSFPFLLQFKLHTDTPFPRLYQVFNPGPRTPGLTAYFTMGHLVNIEPLQILLFLAGQARNGFFQPAVRMIIIDLIPQFCNIGPCFLIRRGGSAKGTSEFQKPGAKLIVSHVLQLVQKLYKYLLGGLPGFLAVLLVPGTDAEHKVTVPVKQNMYRVLFLPVNESVY
jgi:hypothetical protein